tara:strand:+ start:236 stop:496 length:261 start_codon:yes stop_codon:yes gene_type:complete
MTDSGEPDDTGRYEIIEVHYDDDGKIISAHDVKLIGETKEELQELLEQILKDIKDSPLLSTGQAYAHRNYQETSPHKNHGADNNGI